MSRGLGRTEVGTHTLLQPEDGPTRPRELAAQVYSVGELTVAQVRRCAARSARSSGAAARLQSCRRSGWRASDEPGWNILRSETGDGGHHRIVREPITTWMIYDRTTFEDRDNGVGRRLQLIPLTADGPWPIDLERFIEAPDGSVRRGEAEWWPDRATWMAAGGTVVDHGGDAEQAEVAPDSYYCVPCGHYGKPCNKSPYCHAVPMRDVTPADERDQPAVRQECKPEAAYPTPIHDFVMPTHVAAVDHPFMRSFSRGPWVLELRWTATVVDQMTFTLLDGAMAAYRRMAKLLIEDCMLSMALMAEAVIAGQARRVLASLTNRNLEAWTRIDYFPSIRDAALVECRQEAGFQS
jgi:hypothetical protein